VTKAIPEERPHVPAASREVQLALARQAEARGDEAAAITHLAAACALSGVAADWVALGETLLADPPDALRRRVIAVLRAVREGPPTEAPVRAGRNDPCPCGSGQKY